MAEITGMTFAELRLALESYGLKARDVGDCIVYADPDGRPMILFPQYRDEDIVRPVHILMARSHLIASGLMDEPKPTLEPRIFPATRKKVPSIAPRA